MKNLIDNDVFFSAMYAGHEHHILARTWLDAEKENGWALATETWLAALRLFMNPALLGPAKLSGSDAWKVVKTECTGKHPATMIYPENPPEKKIFTSAQGHRQVMDFWLVQLARQEDLKVATFDKALKVHWPEDVLLISTES